MRILLVIHGYPPYYMAGSEVYTYNLAREVAKTNDVFVFHRIEDKSIPLHQFFDTIEESVHIRKINNYEPTPATFYDKYLNPKIDDAFREYVKKVNPDVVHIGHLSHLSTQIPIIAKREFGLPVFFTIHDFWMFCHRGQLINPQNREICPLPNVAQCTKCAAFHYQQDDFDSRLIEERDEHIRQTLDCIDVFFAPSHTLENFFVDMGVDQRKIVYAKYGFNVSKLAKHPKELHPEITFGFTGRIIHTKGVHLLCEALDVPRGTFYNHIYRNKRDKTLYKQRREELRIEIKKIYDDSNQIFGAKKICAILKERGHSITKEMVAELMRDQGLCSIRQDAKDLYKKDKRQLKNTLNQQFDTSRPDEVWVSDVTCFRTNSKNYYISVVLDLYSRMVISYGVSRRNSTQLIRRTFQDAFNHRSPLLPLTFHTDRGSNYRSETFCNLLQQLGVTQSFSKASTPYDNSVVESFFSSLKREELYRKKYRSEKNSERHWMNIWISIMLIGLMLIINTGHQRRQNVIITANMRINRLLELDKGVQVVKLFLFSFRF